MNSFRAYQDCCRLAAALFVLWCGAPELHWHLLLRRMKKPPISRGGLPFSRAAAGGLARLRLRAGSFSA